VVVGCSSPFGKEDTDDGLFGAAPPVKEQTIDLSQTNGTDIAVSDSWTVTAPAGSAPAGATFDVSPVDQSATPPTISTASLYLSSGQPVTPLTFRYDVPKPVPPGVDLYLIGADGTSTPDVPAPATVIPTQLDDDRRIATAEVPHLSWWEWVAGETNHFLTSMAGLRTGEPECASQPRPGWLEEVIYLEGKDAPMLVCTGVDPNEDGTAVVKIRNNRGVAMIVTAPVTPKWPSTRTRVNRVL
jgi:hypothetical protein